MYVRREFGHMHRDCTSFLFHWTTRKICQLETHVTFSYESLGFALDTNMDPLKR